MGKWKKKREENEWFTRYYKVIHSSKREIQGTAGHAFSGLRGPTMQPIKRMNKKVHTKEYSRN